MRFGWLFLLFLCLTSCFTSPRTPASLRIAFNNQPITLDPRKSGDFTSATLICLAFEGLTRCGAGEAIEPAAADTIDVSSDGKTYTFYLKKTFWSDGAAVTASDFAASWRESIAPSFPCLSAHLFFPIKNVEKYRQGKVPLEAVGIEVLDAETLRVELENPTPYFLLLTAFPTYFPIPSHLDKKSCWDEGSHLISNGPFQIEHLFFNDEILLIKNQRFWDKKNIALDSIHISILSDETTALQLFERDELDFVGGPLSPLPLDALASLNHQGRLQFVSMDASTFCTFNNQTFPFSNTLLRKAFSYAIDRKNLAKETLQTGQIPAKTLLPPALSCLSEEETQELQFDIDQAKHFLTQGMQEMGISLSDLENITLYYRQGEDQKRLAQTLQKHWKNALGITLKLEQLDQKTHLQKLHQRDYQISLGCWISQFHDPISLLDRFRRQDNAKNYPGWENQEYALLLEQASTSAQSAHRNERLKEAEALFLKEMPIMPLYHWTSPYMVHPKLKNIAITATGGILFERFRI